MQTDLILILRLTNVNGSQKMMTKMGKYWPYCWENSVI